MTLDLIPVSQLTSELGIQKTVLAERRNALGISPVKIGRNSYIAKTDYDLLLELNDWVRSGKTTPEFLKMKGLELNGNVRKNGLETSANALGTLAVDNTSSFIQLVHEIATALQPKTNPIEHWFSLERAAASNLLLSSLEVKQLIGVKPMGSSFTRGSFVFIRYGRIGSSTAWKVEKL